MEIKSNLIFRSDLEIKKGGKYGSLVTNFRQLEFWAKVNDSSIKVKKTKTWKIASTQDFFCNVHEVFTMKKNVRRKILVDTFYLMAAL